MNSIEPWVNFVLEWALVPISIIWIYEATSRVVSRSAKKRHLALGLLGTALLLGNAATGGWLALSLANTLDQTFQPTKVVELSENALAQMSSDDRATKTKLLAQVNFSSNGVLTKYSAPDGTAMTYAPSQAEIEARVSEIRTLVNRPGF